jgi:hypothetical protein
MNPAHLSHNLLPFPKLFGCPIPEKYSMLNVKSRNSSARKKLPNLSSARISCDEKQRVVTGFRSNNLQAVDIVLNYPARVRFRCCRLSNLYMRENCLRYVIVHPFFIGMRFETDGGTPKIGSGWSVRRTGLRELFLSPLGQVSRRRNGNSAPAFGLPHPRPCANLDFCAVTAAGAGVSAGLWFRIWVFEQFWLA